MSWKPVVQVAGEPEGKWSRNGLVFETEQEARDSAADLHGRWLACVAHSAVEVDEPVNYTYHNHILKEVPRAAE